MCSQICFDFLDINIEFTGGDGRLRRVSGGDVASAEYQDAIGDDGGDRRRQQKFIIILTIFNIFITKSRNIHS